MVPDQVIRYVLGSFGKPTAPVEPGVLDRILDRPRARELAAEPPPLSVAELRQRLPHGISDEELLLRFGMPAGEVDAMLAAGPGGAALHPGGAAGAAAAARARLAAAGVAGWWWTSRGSGSRSASSAAGCS